MAINQIFLILGLVGGILMIACVVALFFVSRRSQKVMESLLTLMMRPERARVNDATRVLQNIMADEIAKIESGFARMCDTLNSQIETAKELKNSLTVQNAQLVATTDDATKKLATMSQRLDNTISGLQGIVESSDWSDIETTTEKFNANVNELLAKINATSLDSTERVAQIQSNIDAWVERGRELSQTLQAEFEHNTTQMQEMAGASDEMQGKLSALAESTTGGFTNIKNASAEYESVLDKTNKMLDAYLVKMDSFSKQSKKQLTSQMNTLTNTANVVGGQVRLAESSIEKQIRKLTDAVEALMSSATTTETSVRGISGELAALTNRFDGEIKEFATGVVSELKTVSGVANITLENTKTAAGAFSDSVRAMATGVRETLMEMNTAHTQLSGQSENLIKLSAQTTEQLQPLSELMERYFAALPDLSQSASAAGENLDKIVADLNEKINLMNSTVAQSTTAISESAVKLEDLAGTSRQQMIDLMADYAKAVETMQTLNKQMMVARATAPMDAIATAPAAAKMSPRVSSADFLKQSERMFDKMHEQSLDLTRAAGAEIPDVVWKKYHAGDKTIFSKWLAKMMAAADKKQIRDLLKSDAVFRSQATQFVRSFDKVLAAAQNADNADKLGAMLIKTDLGQVYISLKPHLG